MKKLLPFLLAISLFEIPKGIIAQNNTPKIYAMVVGISKYLDGNIPSLKFAENDAVAFAFNLQTPGMGAVPSQNISLLTNEKATRGNILKELVQLLSRSGPEDLFIFYFSGHGKNDELENSGYLLTYDTENGNEAGSAISMDDINSKIGRGKAKMKVSYIDACHAGLFKSSGTKGSAVDNAEIVKAYQSALANASDGNVAFLASSARQQSLEDEKLGHGVFTYYLIKGLAGEADKEQKSAAGYDDGIVTVSELGTYLTRTIEEATKYKQKPAVEGIVDTDFPLSVLKAGTNITGEIKKRPKAEKKTELVLNIPASTKIPEKVKLSAGNTFSKPYCYGVSTITNKFNYPVILQQVKGYYNISGDNLIAPGQSYTTSRIILDASAYNGIDRCADLSYDCEFKFKMIENGKEKFASITFTLESGYNIPMIISPDNLFFH